MSYPTQETAHVATGLALLREAFKRQTVVKGILSAFLKPFQDLEDMLWDMASKRKLANSTGDQLDHWGTVVGEPREGRGDTEYRAAIRLRIRVNLSEGTAEDIIQILALAFPEATLREYREGYPAGFRVDAHAVTSPVSAAARALKQARAGGVRGQLITTKYHASRSEFRFTTGAGVGWTGDSTLGGRLAWAKEL